MPSRSKFVLPCDEPQKPAKERIAHASQLLFQYYGLNVGLPQIAQMAGTQTAFVVKYYGSLERLQFDFLKSLFKRMDEMWREAEGTHPNDPEAQLRCWIYFIQIQANDCLSEQWQLSRMA